jgi:type I restriction enzyme M protein
MMVKLVDPKIGETICDPAAGTAGFLTNAFEHILEENTSKDILEYDEEGQPHHLIGDQITDRKLMNFLKSKAITGYDFDTTMTRIGAMNLMLHGIDNPNFKYSDTLAKSFNEKEMYDVVLANPPFKGSIDKSDINERFKVKTTKTELLFLELMHDMLVTGGRCGVIVPDGVLFGSSNAHKDIRKMLTEKCRLEGVISMPSGVFKPYAGVSTAVLIFQKGATTDKVWFYDMQADGYSLDDKRDKIKDNDIPDILEKWEVRQTTKIKNERSDKNFFVPIVEIKENNYDLSINRYKKIVYEEVKYESPKDILQKIKKIEKEIINEIEILSGNL